MSTGLYRFIRNKVSNDKVAHDIDNANRRWYKERHADYLGEKQSFINKMKDCTEDGMVAIVSSGMDCDGVKYSGQVHYVKAIPVLVQHDFDEAKKWADGPIYRLIIKPSEARLIEYTSRDLGMEAFENGHPYYLTECD